MYGPLCEMGGGRGDYNWPSLLPQAAEWMSVTLSVSMTLWSSGIYEGTKVQWLLYLSISAMMMLLHGFLSPPTASHSIQLFPLYFSTLHPLVPTFLLTLRRT